MICPALLNIMNRVLLVPWSIAPTHLGAELAAVSRGVAVEVVEDAFIIASTSLRIKSSNVCTFTLSCSDTTLLLLLLLLLPATAGKGVVILEVPVPLLPDVEAVERGDDRPFFFTGFFPIF